MIDKNLLKRARAGLEKLSAVPMGPMPPPPPIDPATGQPAGAPPGGMPPGMDPSMGGMPPGMDPSMGGMPPGMDPSMGGMPPMDPSMGGMPPGMDPSMMDPSMMGAPAGTPLTEERLMELLPDILAQAKEADKPASKDEIAQRLDSVEEQLYEILQTLGMAPPPDPSETGVMDPGTPALPPEATEDPLADGVTPEAMEAAAAGAPVDPSMMGGMPPPQDPSMMGAPAGMPVMASERTRPSASRRIQGLVSALRKAR
jgi:hypothetical protein